MAFAIPKLQYKNVTLTGNTTSGSGTIAGLTSTASLAVGMFASGAGIPVGATIGSLTSNSFTLAGGVLATATATGVSIDFGNEISFDYPPKEPKGEALEVNATQSESLSGVRQVSLNNIEAKRSLTFSFLSPAIYAQLDSFLKNHALLGSSFRYFEDKTLTTYVDYELDSLKTSPKKISPRGVDLYVWELPLTFRRVL